MVQHILADTGSPGTVEIDGCHYGGIIGNKEVTVYGCLLYTSDAADDHGIV